MSSTTPTITPESNLWPSSRLFAALLGGLIVLCFWPVLLGGQSFYFRDFGSFGYPLAYYHKECFGRGELPLWNPLSACGLPFLAQWNTLTVYPLSLIYLLLPLPWSLNLFVLMHLFIAGLGMFFLAREWTANPRAATLAGLAFAVNGLLLSALMWPNNMAAFGWMPWVLWLTGRATRIGGKAIYLAALVGALQMLAGAPEVILLTWITIGAIHLAEILAGGFGNWRPSAARSGRILLVIALVAALAAIQLLPFLDLLRHSQRTGDFGGTTWAMPPSGWANLLLPLFRSHPTAPGVYYQPYQYWTSSYYVGATVVAFAILAVRSRPSHKAVALGVMVLLGMLMALASVHSWASHIFPPLSILRFPVKFVVLPVFALPLLAGFGWAEWERVSSASSWQRWSRTFKVFALPALLVALAAVMHYLWPLIQDPSRSFRWDTALRFVLLASMAITAGAVLRYSIGSRNANIAFGVMALLLTEDFLSQAHRLNPTVNAEKLAPMLLNESELTPLPNYGKGRVLLTKPTHDWLNDKMEPDNAQDVLKRRYGLVGNYNLLDDIANATGFYSLYLPAQNEVWEQLFFAPAKAFPAPLADFLGITFVPDPAKTLAWQYRPSAMPLITAGQQPVYLPPSNHLAKIVAPTFAPRRVVYLPDLAQGHISAVAQTNVQILNPRFTAQRIEFEVSAEQPAMISIAQAAYHPWRAYIDDQPTTLWTANHAFQALETPSGHHQVRLVYEDRVFKIGAWISGISLLGLLMGQLLYRNPNSS